MGYEDFLETGRGGGERRAGAGEMGSGKAETKWNRRVYQFATVFLFSPSAGMVTCPAAMTDGAAVLLSAHVGDEDGNQAGVGRVLREYRRRLVSRDKNVAYSSGQWMTERTGGSDVSGTESVAFRMSAGELEADERAFGGCGVDAGGMKLGPWRVEGYKWFSSATDADVVVLLARTERGISTFVAPMRRRVGGEGHRETVMNGVRIVRLKDKMGTKQLPTAEVEIKSMRAWLVGEEGKGIKEISAILNTTRLWTAVGAVAGFGRGLAIARAFSRVRKVKGALLQDNPQHVSWMASETVKYWAACHFVFFGAALQGVSEQEIEATQSTKAQPILPQSRTEAEFLLRVLTPVMKAQCSLASVNGLRACMESLGGVGYCENNQDGGVMNVAKIFRDTNVNCIWEGTTSVMAEDLVRGLKGRQGGEVLRALDGLVCRALDVCEVMFPKECKSTAEVWKQFMATVSELDVHELHYRGRELLMQVEKVVCAALLMFNATVSGDAISEQIATRWVVDTISGSGNGQKMSWKEDAVVDREIFVGSGIDHLELKSKI